MGFNQVESRSVLVPMWVQRQEWLQRPGCWVGGSGRRLPTWSWAWKGEWTLAGRQGNADRRGLGCVQGSVLLRRWEFQECRQLKRGSEMAASLYYCFPQKMGMVLKFNVHPLPAPRSLWAHEARVKTWKGTRGGKCPFAQCLHASRRKVTS